MNDEEKDLFIKKELKEDTLISQNANKIFNEFLKGEISMDQNNDNNLENQEIQQQDVQQNQQEYAQQQNQEQESSNTENVFKLDGSQKQKLSKKKRIVTIAASVLIIFLATNCFAAALGYNNIFFMIRNLINHEDIFAGGKDAIFTDRDITISYDSIEVAHGVFIQINEFIAKDNKATLKVTYQQLEQHDVLNSIAVMDEKENVIGSYDITKYSNMGSIAETFDIDLEQYKANMNILLFKLSENNNEVARIKIDLDTRTIDILSNGLGYELTKLSEVELKQVLGQYVMINYYEDCLNGSVSIPKQDYMDAFMVDMATTVIDDVNPDNVGKILNEIYGRSLDTSVSLNTNLKSIARLDSNTNKYVGRGNDGSVYGHCINISDIKFENGIYTVTFSYCYLQDDGELISNKIPNADLYETTFKFKLNDNYQYFRYQIIDAFNIQSQCVKEGNYDAIIDAENNNTNPNTPTNHEHQWSVYKYTGPGHLTLDGTHTAYCTICGQTKSEPHHFGKKWYSLTLDPEQYTATHNNAWTLWDTDCGAYVYTLDYDLVRNSGYEYDPMQPASNLEELVKGTWSASNIMSTGPGAITITEVFGTGVNQSNKMTFGDNGSFSYAISITSGYGGESYYTDGYLIYYSVASDVAGNYTWHHVSYDASGDRLIETIDENTCVIYRRSF